MQKLKQLCLCGGSYLMFLQEWSNTTELHKDLMIHLPPTPPSRLTVQSHDFSCFILPLKPCPRTTREQTDP